TAGAAASRPAGAPCTGAVTPSLPASVALETSETRAGALGPAATYGTPSADHASDSSSPSAARSSVLVVGETLPAGPPTLGATSSDPGPPPVSRPPGSRATRGASTTATMARDSAAKYRESRPDGREV